MITYRTFIPDGLERRFGQNRSIEQIPCTQTHEGGARDHTVGVHNVLRPECLCHGLSLLFHVVSRDLIEVSADDHVCPPIEAARDKVRETPPVATGKLFKRDNRHNDVRLGCDKADERLEGELRVES